MVVVVGLAAVLAAVAVATDRLGLWDRRREGLTNDWVGAMLLGIAALAASVVLAERIPATIDSTLPLYLGMVCLMAGTGLLTWALANVRGYRRLRTAADPGAARTGPGRVAVSGTVEPTAAEGTVTGPFSDDRVVCVESRITERSSEDDDGSNLVHEESVRLPFHLVGPTGRVRVDPAGAELRVAHDVRAEVGPDEVPEWLRASLDERGRSNAAASDGSGSVGGWTDPSVRRSYLERNLAVGDDVVVLGTARRAEGTLVVDGGNPFVVEEGTLATTRATYRRVVLQGGTAGVVLLLVGTVAMGVVL